MTPTTRRRGTAPDAGAVEALTGSRLAKAPDTDPVLGAGTPAPRRARRAPGVGAKEQLKVWVTPEDAERIRGAFLRTRDETGYRSLSDLVVEATLGKVKRLEKAHNDGQPFPPATPGDLPTGRPVGS